MMLKEGEIERLRKIREKIKIVRNVSSGFTELETESFVTDWDTLSKIKKAMGNLGNDIHFIAELMAKNFLTTYHPELQKVDLDISTKPQGSPGLDIDIKHGGFRVIAEIKTMAPCTKNKKDFGANQRKTIENDFNKLAANKADYKYFFVTNKEAWDIIRDRHKKLLKDAALVLLPEAINADSFVYNTLSLPEESTIKNNPVPTRIQRSNPHDLKDEIQQCIMDMVNARARQGEVEITIRSGDVQDRISKPNRYPAICNGMEHLDRSYSIKLLNKWGKNGANFYVTYAFV